MPVARWSSLHRSTFKGSVFVEAVLFLDASIAGVPLLACKTPSRSYELGVLGRKYPESRPLTCSNTPALINRVI